jgi:potassium-dependent mechanosensitive channel
VCAVAGSAANAQPGQAVGEPVAQPEVQADAQVGAQGTAQVDEPETGGRIDPDRAALAAEIANERGILENPETVLEAGIRQAALDQFTAAAGFLDRTVAAAEKIASWKAQAADAPTLLSTIRAELAQPVSDPVLPDVSGLSLADLEQRLAEANAQVGSARSQFTELQAESDRRQSRRSEIPREVAELRNRLDEVTTRRAGMTVESSDPVSRGRFAAVNAEVLALMSEIEALEAEIGTYDARRDLLPARRDRATRRVAERERAAALYLELVNRRRQADADAAVLEAERQRLAAARQDPALQEFAAETKRLADERAGASGIPQRISSLEAEQAQLRRSLSSLREQYQNLKRRLEVSGVNRATGIQLRQQFEKLPDIRQLRKRANALRLEIEEAEYLQIELRELRDEAGNIQATTGRILEGVTGPGEGSEVSPVLMAAARELAIARRDLLDQLVADAANYSEQTFQVEASTRELLDAAESFELFIRERILWVRSISGSRLPTLGEFKESAVLIGNLRTWTKITDAIRLDVRDRWPLTGFVAIGLLGLFWFRRWSKKRITAISELVRSFRTDAYKHTLVTVLLTFGAALAWPTFFYWLGWLIARPAYQHPVGSAIGIGLQHGAVLLYPLAVAARSLRRNSLAETHFRWPTVVVRRLRRQLRWLLPTMLGMLVVVAAADTLRIESVSSAVGRTGLVGAMTAVLVFILTTLHPKSIVLVDYYRKNASGLMYKGRYVLFVLIAAIPIILSVITLLGYYYSALQLLIPLKWTIGFLLLILLVNGMLLRWLYITRRRVAVEDARRRREQAVAEQAKAAKPDGETAMTGEGAGSVIEEDKLDLPAINAQTRQLFKVGLTVAFTLGIYFTWAGVLPALRYLERVEIWPNTRVVESSVVFSLPLLEGPLPENAGAATGGQGDGPGVAGESVPATGQGAGQGGSQGSGQGSGGALPLQVMPGGSGSEAVEGSEENASGGTVSVVTLADVGLALLLLVATLATFKNLPGLIEILILQRLPLDAGSRYAMTTVLRYMIVILGLLAASTSIGFSWSSIQWLAAALTFGLAFGLQEIFANFISGLIILAERPIRIGDTVTIGQISGTVTRIRMRATTITDWDRKELIIPNKTFITSDVINWTLSDTTLRLRIPVGVGYGEDIDLAERVLIEVAAGNKNVMSEPKPHVLFNGFGDSTLNFELRCFLPHIEHMISVRHDLHMRITKRFRQEGIEIAFPQRDLHIRSADGLAEAIQKAGKLSAQLKGENADVAREGKAVEIKES